MRCDHAKSPAAIAERPGPTSRTATDSPVTADDPIQVPFGDGDSSRLSLQDVEDAMIDHRMAEVKGNVPEAA